MRVIIYKRETLCADNNFFGLHIMTLNSFLVNLSKTVQDLLVHSSGCLCRIDKTATSFIDFFAAKFWLRTTERAKE